MHLRQPWLDFTPISGSVLSAIVAESIYALPRLEFWSISGRVLRRIVAESWRNVCGFFVEFLRHESMPSQGSKFGRSQTECIAESLRNLWGIHL